MTALNIEITTGRFMCGAEVFRINGRDADTSDFGYMADVCPDEAPEYGCGCRVFESRPADPQTLEKYGITLEQYSEICEELRQKLYVGKCSMCS